MHSSALRLGLEILHDLQELVVDLRLVAKLRLDLFSVQVIVTGQCFLCAQIRSNPINKNNKKAQLHTLSHLVEVSEGILNLQLTVGSWLARRHRLDGTKRRPLPCSWRRTLHQAIWTRALHGCGYLAVGREREGGAMQVSW